VQNRFLNYAGYCLNIFHLSHDYQPINDVLRLDSLASRRQTHGYRFIRGLLKGQIDVPRLLEVLSIQIPNSTRSQETFYIPTSRTNFADNAHLLRMMHIYNSNIL